MKQKAILFVLIAAGGMLFGCASADKEAGTYSGIIRANQDCRTDADCVAVNRTCCRCDGKVAVNRRVASRLRAKWLAECTTAPCLQNMCYTDMEVSCTNNRCVGRLSAQ